MSSDNIGDFNPSPSSKHLNIESMPVFLGLVQESQELLSGLRHVMRGESKFQE